MHTGDEKRQCYVQWVHTHGPVLYALAYRLTGQHQRAEDLVQETLTEAWKSMHTLTDAGKARAWLFSILRHRWSHLLRDESRRPSLQLEGALANRDVPAPDVSSGLEQSEVLQQALNVLEDQFKLPLLMVLMEGKTCREVAELLDIPLGTVLSRLYRARVMLRERFSRSDRAGAPASAPRLRLGGE